MDTFTPYYGEFLVSTAPLELSFSYCSHKCAYCFANLNTPDRKADILATVRTLANFQQRDTLTARLLKAGYPTVVSNRVDPFANSNYRQAVPVIRTMIDCGLPIAFQTRGGRGVDEVLKASPPSVWYVSLNLSDDATRRKLEPGAPSLPERWSLIDDLVQGGHSVVIGLNPLVPEWCPDYTQIIAHAAECGACGVWAESLHMRNDQIMRMSPRERNAATPDVLDMARKRFPPQHWLDALYTARQAAISCGMQFFATHMPYRSDFWDIYRKHYPSFPVMQDVTNAVVDGRLRGLISVDDILAVLEPSMPRGVYTGMQHYAQAVSRATRLSKPLANTSSYTPVVAWASSDRTSPSFPGRNPLMPVAAEWSDELRGWIELTDEGGRPYFVVDGKPYDGEYRNPAEIGIKEA